MPPQNFNNNPNNDFLPLLISDDYTRLLQNLTTSIIAFLGVSISYFFVSRGNTILIRPNTYNLTPNRVEFSRVEFRDPLPRTTARIPRTTPRNLSTQYRKLIITKAHESREEAIPRQSKIISFLIEPFSVFADANPVLKTMQYLHQNDRTSYYLLERYCWDYLTDLNYPNTYDTTRGSLINFIYYYTRSTPIGNLDHETKLVKELQYHFSEVPKTYKHRVNSELKTLFAPEKQKPADIDIYNTISTTIGGNTPIDGRFL